MAAIIFCLSAQSASAQTTTPKPNSPTVSERAQLDHAQQIMRRHGRFFTHKTWGPVWKPNTGKTWRPYTLGRWARTPGDTDWEWISSEPFGDTVYHYGRWTRDNDNGWIWIPGSRRAPAWVNWRQNAKHIGWAPIPPATPTSTPSTQTNADNGTVPDPASDWVFIPRNKITNAGIKKYIVAAAKTRNLFDTTVAITKPRAKTKRIARKARVETNKAQDKPTTAERNKTFAQGDASGDEYDYNNDYDNAVENRDYDTDDENVATPNHKREPESDTYANTPYARDDIDKPHHSEPTRQEDDDTDRSRRYGEDQPRDDDDEYFIDDEDYDDDRSIADRRAARRRFQHMEPAHRLPKDRWRRARQRREHAFADARRRMEETKGQIRARARVRARAMEMRRRFLLDNF